MYDIYNLLNLLISPTLTLIDSKSEFCKLFSKAILITSLICFTK